jgi:hypothetical protein
MEIVELFSLVDKNVLSKWAFEIEKHKKIYIPSKINVIMIFISKFIPRKRLINTLG